MHQLTESNYDVLCAMENIVDDIAVMLGDSTEALLHCLDAKNLSIMESAANGHITGREVDALSVV